SLLKIVPTAATRTRGVLEPGSRRFRRVFPESSRASPPRRVPSSHPVNSSAPGNTPCKPFTDVRIDSSGRSSRQHRVCTPGAFDDSTKRTKMTQPTGNGPLETQTAIGPARAKRGTTGRETYEVVPSHPGVGGTVPLLPGASISGEAPSATAG